MTDNSSNLSRHDWRKLVKKLRRKRIRQEVAMKREKENLVSIVEDGTDSESENEDERKQRHQKWLRDEEDAQKRQVNCDKDTQINSCYKIHSLKNVVFQLEGCG